MTTPYIADATFTLKPSSIILKYEKKYKLIDPVAIVKPEPKLTKHTPLIVSLACYEGGIILSFFRKKFIKFNLLIIYSYLLLFLRNENLSYGLFLTKHLNESKK